MRHIHPAFLFIILIAFGCAEKPAGTTTNIEGHFPDFAEKQVVLEELEIRETVPVDSAIIDSQGNFRFEFPVSDAGFFVIKTANDNLLLMQLEPGEQVIIRSSQQFFNDGYEISGSPGSALLLEYEKFMTRQRQRIDSIASLYYDARGEADFLTYKSELDSAYEAIVMDQRDYIYSFGKEHPGSLTSLIVINRRLGQNQVLDEEKDFKLFHTIDSALMLNYPENKHSRDHHDRVKEIQGRIFDRRVAEEKVKTGKRAPDIVLNDSTGNPISLKSYLGNPVILQFWAGWNAVSRSDNQQLAKIYPDLKSKGVQILGVSLDDNAVIWKGAIKLDQLKWKQVSDLQGMRSDVAKSYNLPDELPFYYLLDHDLIITYKNNSLDSVLIHLEQLNLQAH